MNSEEQRIIELLRKGDNSVFKYLYDKHYALLCRVAYDYVKDDFLAETIVSDLISHIYERRETLIITTSLRAFLFRAVKNRCLNYLELQYEQNEVSFSSLNNTDNPFTASDLYEPLGILLEKELESEIEKAMNRLPEECRKVFMKRRFEDKSYKEIADEQGISVNTVKYHLKNALNLLYKNLKKYF